MQRKVTYLWKEPGAAKSYRAGVSLHGHTNHSKESLYFILHYASRSSILSRALASQTERSQVSSITVDFRRGYWTPPLPPLAAFQLERDQIQNVLGLPAMVSLSDHDNIEAPMLLRVVPEARQIPVSVEWSVRFRDIMVHLGVHNLPSGQAEAIMAELAAFSASPSEDVLAELLEMLHAISQVLIVLNHPLWDMVGIGRERHVHTLSAFMADLGMFVHAFELNGLRTWDENQRVLQLAEGWNQPVIAGGDRHALEPSAVVNLTNAENFSEFVREIRKARDSRVLFMPQYKEPMGMRRAQTVLDVVREYPDYPQGSRRWDDRTFHPDSRGAIRPLSSLWSTPPAFIGAVFAVMRLLEEAPVRTAMQYMFGRPEEELRFLLDGQEVSP